MVSRLRGFPVRAAALIVGELAALAAVVVGVAQFSTGCAWIVGGLAGLFACERQDAK